ncbi:phage terminase small subunit P27 family [Xanthobacter sp. DSM 24535]|uniref:phage terminase small subunit P27 family n=1 Tax=Roseixanthobacter psychrophilus TaxID=3119917 RepID=UPI003729C840
MTRGVRPTLKTIDGGLKRAPPVPATISPGMEEVWRTIAADLTGRGLLTTSMLTVLETYVGAVWLARECRKSLADDGPVVRGTSGVPKPHPAGAMLKSAHETIARLADELGITPSSRSRPGIREQESKADADADPTREWDF